MQHMTSLNKLLSDHAIKISDLRKDILSILLKTNKAISAYEVLEQLKKKRPNAAPSTVYRVLDYLIIKNAVHRIESTNQYILCSQGEPIHPAKISSHGFLFICKTCLSTIELFDKELISALNKAAKKSHIKMNETLVEVRGVCEGCWENL